MDLDVRCGAHSLHIGYLEVDENGVQLVASPAPGLFEQLMANMSAGKEHKVRGKGDEARAAAAMCFRWGSYFALLADEERPLAESSRQPEVSRVRDSEMARINIETTSNLCAWLELRAAEPDRYARIVAAATALPMPPHRSRRALSPRAVLDSPQATAIREWLRSADPGRVAATNAAPIRSLSNAVFHSAWRNGAIEDFHAGLAVNVDFRERRFSAEEANLITTQAIDTCAILFAFADAFSEQWKSSALSDYILPLVLNTPIDWSTSESCRDVKIYPQ